MNELILGAVAYDAKVVPIWEGFKAHTAGLNEEVFDALLLLAARSWEPSALRRGHAAVVGLRLGRLGFSADDAARLSSLHTRNFM
jgi:hypothetical protein